MTRLVIDASVALSWIFEDESNVNSEAILRSLEVSTVVVPSHWNLEVVNALLSAERKGRITSADATKGLSLLDCLPISVDNRTAEISSSQTLALARAHRLTIYDAAYLELCLREGIGLATFDRDLISACKSMGVALVLSNAPEKEL